MRKASSILAALLLARSIATGHAQQTNAPEAPAPDANLIRVWGFDGMKPLLLRWETGYTKDHPEAHFSNTLNRPAPAMAGLYNRGAHIVVTRRELCAVHTPAAHWLSPRHPPPRPP